MIISQENMLFQDDWDSEGLEQNENILVSTSASGRESGEVSRGLSL